MGIIYSNIYKKYFPIKERFTQFTEQKKRILCRWAKKFKADVKTREFEKANHMNKCGVQHSYIHTYDLDFYSADVTVDMIMKNQFDEQGLYVINSIIYGHKYNSLLFTFFFPILTSEHYERLLN